VKKIEAIIKPFKLEEVKQSLSAIGVVGMSVSEVRGSGRQPPRVETYRGLEYAANLIPGVKLEVVVPDARADQVVSFIINEGYTLTSRQSGIVRAIVFRARAPESRRAHRPPDAALAPRSPPAPSAAASGRRGRHWRALPARPGRSRVLR